MVKGQKEKKKDKSFYVWMLSGALVVIGISALYLNIGKLDNGEMDPKQDNQKIAKEFALEQDLDNGNAVEDSAIKDNAQVAETPMQEENLLENDIVDDAQLAEVQEPKEAQTQTSKEPETVSVMGTNNILDSLSFNQEAGLTWPANGNVIMNYSDDKGIYFATLASYRVNPAIVISAQEGDKVVSAAKGMVTKIFENEETGVTLEMSIGDDYNLTYGQLKDLAVKEGDMIEEGQLIGYIAKPSKYYVVEGSNLYFKVMQGDKTVNPMYLLK